MPRAMTILLVDDHTHGVPCFRYRVKGHEALSAALVDQAYEERRLHPGTMSYGSYDGETTWHSRHLPLDGARSPLLALIDEVVALRWSAVGWRRDTHPWRVAHLWTNIAGPGDATLCHHHLTHGGNAVFGGTYYAKVPAEGGNFLACSPDAGLKCWGSVRPRDHAPFEVPHWWSVEPQAGDVVLFPAWVLHAVAPNRSHEDRIAWTFLCEMDMPLEVNFQHDQPQYEPMRRHPEWRAMLPKPRQ